MSEPGVVRVMPSSIAEDRARTRAISRYVAHKREFLLSLVSDRCLKDKDLKRRELVRLGRLAFNRETEDVQREYVTAPSASSSSGGQVVATDASSPSRKHARGSSSSPNQTVVAAAQPARGSNSLSSQAVVAVAQTSPSKCATEDTLTSHPVLACATPSPQRTAPVRSDGTKHARPMSSFDMPVDLSLLEPKRAQPSGGFQMPVDLSLRNPGTKRAKPGTKPAPVGSFDMLNLGAKPSQPGASFDMPEQVPAEDGADHASAVAAAVSLAGQASAQPGHAGRLPSDLSKQIPWL